MEPPTIFCSKGVKNNTRFYIRDFTVFYFHCVEFENFQRKIMIRLESCLDNTYFFNRELQNIFNSKQTSHIHQSEKYVKCIKCQLHDHPAGQMDEMNFL